MVAVNRQGLQFAAGDRAGRAARAGLRYLFVQGRQAQEPLVVGAAGPLLGSLRQGSHFESLTFFGCHGRCRPLIMY